MNKLLSQFPWLLSSQYTREDPVAWTASQEKHLHLNHCQHGKNYLVIIGMDPPGPPKRVGGKGEADFILTRFFP